MWPSTMKSWRDASVSTIIEKVLSGDLPPLIAVATEGRSQPTPLAYRVGANTEASSSVKALLGLLCPDCHQVKPGAQLPDEFPPARIRCRCAPKGKGKGSGKGGAKGKGGGPGNGPEPGRKRPAEEQASARELYAKRVKLD